MIITSLCLFAAASAKPLQVIIMAGQSNMVGHGYAEGSNLHWNATVGYDSNICYYSHHHHRHGHPELKMCSGVLMGT